MLTIWIMWMYAVFSLFGSVLGLVNHGYMTQYYYSHKPVFVNDSMVLELTNKFLSEAPGKRFLTCDVNIVTSPNRRLLIHFLSLEISYKDEDIDRLHIYDFLSSGEAVRLSPAQGLYGVSDSYHPAPGLVDYTSTSNRLKLDYQGKPTLAYNGFKILITAFRDARGDCGRGYMRCNRKEICIPVSSWCDGNPNCGGDDRSDESSCDLGPGHTWNPIDGAVTAVVAAAVSCTLFLITVAALVVVVLRLNKRDVVNQNNITIKFKQKGTTKRQMSKTGEYAPPAYEVVIGMDGAPPPYTPVASADDTGSDIIYDERSEGFAENGDPVYHTLEEPASAKQNTDGIATNNIRVTCDIHGNNIRTSEVSPRENGRLELTKLHLTSEGTDNDALVRSNSRRAKTNSLEIEVLESRSEPENDDCDGVTGLCNGHAKVKGVSQNGHCKARMNGDTVVSYSADTAETDSGVEFIRCDS